MAKMITRTITVYTYTTGKVDLSSMKITDVKTLNSPYKLGSRDKKALVKDHGNPIISESSRDVLYGMSIEDFVRYGNVIDVPDAEGSEE